MSSGTESTSRRRFYSDAEDARSKLTTEGFKATLQGAIDTINSKYMIIDTENPVLAASTL